MTRGYFKVFTITVFILTASVIGALVFLPGFFFSSKNQNSQPTRVVIPQTAGAGETLRSAQGEEAPVLRLALNEGEAAVAVLTRDFDSDSYEEQIIAYHKLQEIDSPVYLTYAEFDEQNGLYYRLWSEPTAVTRPGTLILYSEYLIGDGGICILVSGMNGAGEQTLTVFRKIPSTIEPFAKIAEFRIEGSIAVEEPDRSDRGTSRTIATYGRDYESANIMDQIETSYTFNQVNGLYEQYRVVKIPGTQIEQRMVRELLNGENGKFENFISGLWYQGEGTARKYVYFNTASREMIFYDNNSEEIFSWQDSTPTRYGIHINSRNISLTKLRRTVNVELASLESIRLRVYQDVYLRSGLTTNWDGSYQRLQHTEIVRELKQTAPYTNGTYAGRDGQITFHQDGSYELNPLAGSPELGQKGQYVFFSVGEDELLELRPAETGEKRGKKPELIRETFRVSRKDDQLTLTRIRITTRGIQDMYEPPIVLNPSG